MAARTGPGPVRRTLAFISRRRWLAPALVFLLAVLLGVVPMLLVVRNAWPTTFPGSLVDHILGPTTGENRNLEAVATAIGTVAVVLSAAYALVQLKGRLERRQATLSNDMIQGLLFPDWAEEPNKNGKTMLFSLYGMDPERDDLLDGAKGANWSRIATSNERLGVLVEQGVADEELVAEMVGERVLRIWHVLRQSILAKRLERGRYGQSFEMLAKRIVRHKILRQPRRQWGRINLGPGETADLVNLVSAHMGYLPSPGDQVAWFTASELRWLRFRRWWYGLVHPEIDAVEFSAEGEGWKFDENKR